MGSCRMFAACLAATLVIRPAFAARPVQPVDGDDAEGAEQPGEVERDDAPGRMRAMREWRSEGAPSLRTGILQEAWRERDRWSSVAPAASSRNALTAVSAGGAFVNIGPTSADSAFNAYVYHETDSGRARQIVPHPTDPNVVYLSTSGGGVWKSYDGGAGWEPIADGLGSLSIGALALDPGAPDVLYLGFGDPFDVQQPGFFKSGDGGATWSDLGVLSTTDYGAARVADSVRDIKVDPRSSLNVFAATNAGLFVSPDGGISFQHVNLAKPNDTTLTYREAWSLAYVGPGAWLAAATSVTATGTAGSAGLWRTTDNGNTWNWLGAALPLSTMGRATLSSTLATTEDAAGSRVFLVAEDVDQKAQLDVWRSDDGGQSWTALGVNASGRPINANPDLPNLNVFGGQPQYNQALLADPEDPNTVYLGGQLGMVRSGDGGRTWSVLSDWLPGYISFPGSYVHADFHHFAVGPDGAFYAGTDGGLFRSPDPFKSCLASGGCGARFGTAESVTFTSKRNDGLSTHLAYHVACAQPGWPAEGANWVAGGLQDNGTRVRTHDTTFDQVVGGDGIGLAVSGTAVTLAGGGVAPSVFLASVAGGLNRADNGGSFSRFTPSPGVPFLVRIARDTAAADPMVFLTLLQPAGVVVSRGGGGWTNVSGTVHWPNGGATTGFLPQDGKTTIAMRQLATHPVVAGVWGAVSGGVRAAYVTSDGGANWTASTQPAPGSDPDNLGGASAFSSIAFDPDDPNGNTYYVTSQATDLLDKAGNPHPLPASFGHLYKTIDHGATWSSLTNGLPNVPFDVVKFDPGNSSVMYLGTEIGLYRSGDKGASWSRFGAGRDPQHPWGLPFVEVTDFCFSPGNDHLVVATYGRGFWQVGTDAVAQNAGIRGRGDTNFDQRIDGRDLLDLADAYGTTQANSAYVYQADLTGGSNTIDDADVGKLLEKLGGAP